MKKSNKLDYWLIQFEQASLMCFGNENQVLEWISQVSQTQTVISVVRAERLNDNVLNLSQQTNGKV